MEMELKPLTRTVLLAGPTASGKSRRALKLAEQYDGIVINADSMQVYGELRILSARPDEADEQKAEHRLYGHVAAARRYSVGAWLQDALAGIAAANEQGRLAIVVGGTGLYFKALTEGLSSIPPITDEARSRVKEKTEGVETAELHALLQVVDPAAGEVVRPSDRVRIIRALEVMEQTGISIVTWNRRESPSPPLAMEGVERFVLAPERAALHQRIGARAGQMVDGGAAGEVAALLELKLEPEMPAMKAIGVREMAAQLRGELTREEAIAAISTETRRYAKRQETWFRNQMGDWKRLPA